jgi:NhaC family Na+:H+ antiporter
MGMGIDASSSAPENITNLMNAIGQIYHFNILLLLPPIIVLYGSLSKRPPIRCSFITIVSMILALVFQQFTASSVGESVVSGFKLAMLTGDNLPTLSSDVSRLLERGGAISMFSSFVTVFSAFSFAGQ